eukprot:5191745-Prorocentrum_lima.AAC.1
MMLGVQALATCTNLRRACERNAGRQLVIVRTGVQVSRLPHRGIHGAERIVTHTRSKSPQGKRGKHGTGARTRVSRGEITAAADATPSGTLGKNSIKNIIPIHIQDYSRTDGHG